MPRTPDDIRIKAEECRNILQRYNGIPSQTVDRKAYAKIKATLQRYGEKPEIKALIEEFNIKVPGRNYKNNKESIEAILMEYQGMPSSSKENTLYHRIQAFFKSHRDDPEVERMMYIYGSNECYPLSSSNLNKPVKSIDILGRIGQRWWDWKSDAIYSYVVYVVERYGVLPARHSKPMELLWESIERYCRYQELTPEHEKENLFNFLDYIHEKNLLDAEFLAIYKSKDFGSEAVQNKVRKILIENGACTVEFVAEHAMAGVYLPVDFVFFYYYMNAMQRGILWHIRPLGNFRLSIEDKANTVLFVHYRDYHLVDVDKVRKSAQAHYRDWHEYPPTNIDEGMAFAQWSFFHTTHDTLGREEHFKDVYTTDWQLTEMEYCFQRGFYTFCNDYDREKMTDYFLFLIENNYHDVESFAKQLRLFLEYGRRHNDEETQRKIVYVEHLLKSNGIDYE